jgi:hypothetical protein
MGQGYTRTDTINNIADGNIINAADFDAEYDAIESAFNSSTGHSHDGTSGEGGPVTVLGPAQDFVASTTEIKPKSNNTLDVGTTGLKFKDLYLAGTANLVNVTTTGDLTLTGAANNIVFDASDNALEFADNAKATFGDAGDLEIYHDASDSIIRDTGTGKLALDGSTVEVRKNDGSEVMAQFVEDGAVSLYHDNSVKLATTATGIAVTGSIALDGLHLDDNEKLTFGNSTTPDLEIYHDGSNSWIEDTGQGNLYISSSLLQIQNSANTEALAKFTEGAGSAFYHANLLKLDTDADGVNVTGQVDVSTNVNAGGDVNLTTDGSAIKLGTSEEVTLTHVHDIGVLLDVENSTTNAVTDVLKLQAKSTGTPAVGIGVGIEFSTETAASTIETGGVIESVTSDLTPTEEDFDMVFKTMAQGATPAERLKLNGSGATIGNINVDGNTIISTDTNGSIVVAPNGAGDVQLDADTVRVGDNNANATITTNGTGDLILNTNAGSSSGSITIEDAANGNIALTPNGTGEVDITKVDIDGGAIDGTIIGANSAAAGTFAALEGTTVTASTSLALASGATVTAILDEDDMATNSNTAIATQQSIKAFVENTISGGSFASGITSGGNITLDDDGNSSPNGFGLVFKEASATYTTTLNKTTPTANRTISLPNETGTVSTQAFANGAAVALAIALG